MGRRTTQALLLYYYSLAELLNKQKTMANLISKNREWRTDIFFRTLKFFLVEQTNKNRKKESEIKLSK